MTKKNQAQIGSGTLGIPVASLRDEYERLQTIYDLQPAIIQRFLEIQARQVAEAFVERSQHLRFTLPDRIVIKDGTTPLLVPEKERNQNIGTFSDRLSGRDLRITLKQRLTELESSHNEAISICSGLIRYEAARYIIYNMLPAGRSVTYSIAEDEEIPCIPVAGLEPESAITAETDAIVEAGGTEEGRGSLQVPYVLAARSFYLPQWVAFDNQGKILVRSIEEAQAHISSMQKFLELLFSARSLAPYIVTDEEFEKKRYGMLGQLVNQGRALARYMTSSIIAVIKERAAAQSLNRGLKISLPFFDDQDLRIEMHRFVVIPAGRIMFVPAFVVRAAQEEFAKVSQDTRLSTSTRKYLLEELSMLQNAFEQVK